MIEPLPKLSDALKDQVAMYREKEALGLFKLEHCRHHLLQEALWLSWILLNWFID
jgi:hypothetical protein